jgi:hypothetical protein
MTDLSRAAVPGAVRQTAAEPRHPSDLCAGDIRLPDRAVPVWCSDRRPAGARFGGALPTSDRRFSQAICNVPPLGIASSAFKARFKIASSSWFGSHPRRP